jgi:CRISPR/Cas system-associated protein endoribonuclease Cas2
MQQQNQLALNETKKKRKTKIALHVFLMIFTFMMKQLRKGWIFFHIFGSIQNLTSNKKKNQRIRKEKSQGTGSMNYH